MTRPAPLPTKSHPAGAGRAAPAAASPGPGAGGGERDDGRQAALSALQPEPQPSAPPAGDGRVPVAWLHIRAPQGAIPSARSTCVCGRDRHAVGHDKVLALIEDHTAHRSTCPLRHGERKKAG